MKVGPKPEELRGSFPFSGWMCRKKPCKCHECLPDVAAEHPTRPFLTPTERNTSAFRHAQQFEHGQLAPVLAVLRIDATPMRDFTLSSPACLNRRTSSTAFRGNTTAWTKSRKHWNVAMKNGGFSLHLDSRSFLLKQDYNLNILITFDFHSDISCDLACPLVKLSHSHQH